MQRKLLLVVPLLLTACISQSEVQRVYVRDQSDCQGYAEDNIDRYLPKQQRVSVADRNAQMVTLFSDCMGKVGWQVAKPKKADEVATTAPNPSPNYPNTYPPTAAAVAAPPAAAVAAPPPTAVPAAATTPAGQAPATYQPAQPQQQGPITYQPAPTSSQPGRSF